MAKSRDAFRTISEVSDALDTPAHVLRFWESKFTQIKPVKRAGGRRYYRPDDLALLAGIKTVLHEQGMTIKGAQKLLRENGVKHVVALGAGKVTESIADDTAVEETVAKAPTPVEPSAPDTVTPNAEPALFEELPLATAKMPPAQDDPIAPIVATPTPPAPVVAAPAPPKMPPAAAPFVPNDIMTAINRAKHDTLQARAAKIAPLVARLETLRDSMRQV